MRLTIKASLIAVVSLMLAMSIGSGWTAISKIQAVGTKTDDIATNWMPSIEALAEIKFVTTRARLDGARFIMAATSEQGTLMQRFDEHLDELNQASSEYRKMITSAEEKALWQKFEQHWSGYVALQKQAMSLAAAGNRDQATRIFDERANVFRSAVEALNSDISFNHKGAGLASTDARATVHSAEQQVWLVSGLSAAVGLFGILFVIFRVTRPLQNLNGAMKEMANGNLAVELSGSGRQDEIGDIAYTVGVIRQNAEDEAVAKQEAQRREDQLRMAQRKADMNKLADDFEAAVGDIIDTVSSASTELEAAAGSLAQTATITQELSIVVASSSEEASTNVQSVAAATEEMSASVQEIGRQVEASTRIANSAVNQAEITDQRISHLSRAASRIGDVSALISAIAGQTNLLALNATIEAARAGEAGRGFAVVASEVKELAAQTAKATQEIAVQIAEIQTATDDSVAIIKEIGTTIGQISEVTTTIAAAVEEQGVATREISHNVQQAAEGTAQVASNIAEVNRGASETGSASSQVLAAAKSLSGDSNKLKLEVGRFLSTVRAA